MSPWQALTLVVPTEAASQNHVVSADSPLRIADDVIVDGDAFPLVISNTGTGLTAVGVNAHLDGDVLAAGPVTLSRSAFIAGRLQAGGVATVPPTATVVGTATSNTPLSTESISLSVRFPEGGSDVAVPTNTSMDLASGHHGDVTAYSGASLRLTDNVYYLNSLHLEPESKLIAVNDQPVILYVRGKLKATRMDASAIDADKLLVVVTGTEVVNIEAPWNGTIWAQNTNTELSPTNGGFLRGAYFGKSEVDD